jgi:hypothetical protein
VRHLALALSGVVESTSYGTPAFRVRGKLLMRLREDGDTLALKEVDDDERDSLIASDPRIFSVTDHYLGYRIVLVRFALARPAALQVLFERSWRRLASKRLLAAYDSGSFAP